MYWRSERSAHINPVFAHDNETAALEAHENTSSMERDENTWYEIQSSFCT